MDSLRVWARDGEAVRQALEWGESARLATASAEVTDALLLWAIERGRLQTWAEAFPAPRREPEIGLEVIWPAQRAARVAGLYSMRQAGEVRRSARGLGALGARVEVSAPTQGVALRGPSDDTLCRGDVGRQLVVQMAQPADPSQAAPRLPPQEPRGAVKGRERAARRAVKPAVEAVAAAGRAPQGAAQGVDGDNQHVGVSLGQ